MERISKISSQMFLKVHQKKKISQIKSSLIIAKKVSKLLNLGYAGIDIKFDKKKLAIFEINGIPSWKGIQKIEKQKYFRNFVMIF